VLLVLCSHEVQSVQPASANSGLSDTENTASFMPVLNCFLTFDDVEQGEWLLDGIVSAWARMPPGGAGLTTDTRAAERMALGRGSAEPRADSHTTHLRQDSQVEKR
jgi:hypothetical protein